MFSISFLRRLIAILIVLACGSSALACVQGACVFAGPRLASVDSQRGLLLNALMGGLLNSSVNLSVLDWQAVAASDLNLGAYLNALKARTTVSSTDEVLQTQVTLLAALTAALDVAQADGNTALVNALNAITVPIAPLTTPIRLGELLQLTFPVGALTDARVNVLDLLTGLVELYNYKNVLTTRQPITLSGSALGLSGVLDTVQVYAQVVEPPIYTCGPAGTTFHTAALRLKLDVDLVDQNLDATALVNALQLALVGTQVTARVALVHLDAYVEVARAEGSIAAINHLAHAVTLDGAPGLVDVYLGRIPDALFYNIARPIDPQTDVQPAPIAKLDLSVKQTALGSLTLAALTGVDVLASSSARGEDGASRRFTVTAPFPRTVTVSSSSILVGNLVGSLAGNLKVTLGSSLGALLDPLVNSVILPSVKTLVGGAIVPPLNAVLSGVVDPLLALLGVQIGEAVFQVLGEGEACACLTLRKEVRNVSANGGFGTSNAARPGDELEYCITYANPGLLDARNVVLRDQLDDLARPVLQVPAYGGKDLTLAGVGLTAAADTDAGGWQGNVVTAQIPAVTPGASGQWCFRAQVL